MTEIVREFVGLPSPVLGRAGAGGHPCQGIYHRPAGGRPPTAFIATHYNVDFSEHYLASLLAGRGYGFLGWNTRFRGNEAYFLLDHALAEFAMPPTGFPGSALLYGIAAALYASIVFALIWGFRRLETRVLAYLKPQGH